MLRCSNSSGVGVNAIHRRLVKFSFAHSQLKQFPSPAVSANARRSRFQPELLGTDRAITPETEQNLLKVDSG